jgi:hypothetical protein
LVILYYDELKKRHYKPVECWGRDGSAAKKFLASGRTEEDFKKLLNKALVCTNQDIVSAACGGLNRFMYRLSDIERLGEAPWEPTEEEIGANVNLIQAATEAIQKLTEMSKHSTWRRGESGRWERVPRGMA